MSLEGNRGPDKRRLGIVEAAAVATALLGAIDQGPAEAMEMPQSMSWEQGVGERIRGAVMTEKRENAAVYILFRDGKSFWPAKFAGEQIRPDAKIATVEHPIVSQEEETFLSKRRGATVEARCTIHTHPDAFSFQTVNGKKFAPQFKPPSDVDVQKQPERNFLHTVYDMNKVTIKNNVSAAADNRGLWYFKSSTKETFDPAAVKEWEKVYGTFVGRSFFDQNFNFEVEYQKLRQAYRDYLGADVRFVAYENIKNEPPCAGVDYVPGKIKQSYDIKVNQPTPKVAPEVAPQQSAGRPSLKELDQQQSRRRLGDDDGPPIYHVGPPQR